LQKSRNLLLQTTVNTRFRKLNVFYHTESAYFEYDIRSGIGLVNF
jgi:hypothetical protein